MKKTFIFLGILLLFLSHGPRSMADDPYCGDGNLDPGEQCDDGNFTNRDGCSTYCIPEDMTPPKVVNVDIEEGATDISTLTHRFYLTFSEAMDPASVNEDTVQLKQFTNVLETTLDLHDNKVDLYINTEESLIGDSEHTIVVKDVKDVAGNTMEGVFTRSFNTGEYIDTIPPTVVAEPEGGHYNIAQAVSLIPYIDERVYSEEFIDKEAVIYYTLDGSTPTEESDVYESLISIQDDTTLKYFAVDNKGNKTDIFTHDYTFSCPERNQAKSVTAYPECRIEECNYGFILKSNVCVIRLGTSDADEYKINAATAPLFGSDTPVTISTKPAIYITPEHEGIIPRPLHFVDLDGGTTIDFKRDTLITDQNTGAPFSGYIKPPDNLYSKSFPINFGYTFKSIFDFEPVEGGFLTFEPMIEITVPFTERYEPDQKITVFTYDANTEEYFVYNPERVSINAAGDAVTILSDSTNTFFIAQPGKNFNSIEFRDTVDHWAKNYIELLYRKGIVKGRSKGVYAPNDILTRAEFTKIALNSVGEEIDLNEEFEEVPFDDVPLYAWHAPYIQRAKEMGLIDGYPDGTFRPDQPINRVEAIKILMNAFDFDVILPGQRTDGYTDVVTGEWYFPYVNYAIQKNLIDGVRKPNGKIMYDTFGPDRNISRAEMAKLAVKSIELNESMQTPESLVPRPHVNK
jgi:cysteine-rich repeat protein